MTTPMFRTIVQYCTLDPHHAQVWWTALSKARWSEPRSWLADVRYFDTQYRSRTAQLDGVLPFLQRTSPPSRVLRVLEDLVKESLLTRQEASSIQEKLLRCVNHRGAWFWSD